MTKGTSSPPPWNCSASPARRLGRARRRQRASEGEGGIRSHAISSQEYNLHACAWEIPTPARTPSFYGTDVAAVVVVPCEIDGTCAVKSGGGGWEVSLRTRPRSSSRLLRFAPSSTPPPSARSRERTVSRGGQPHARSRGRVLRREPRIDGTMSRGVGQQRPACEFERDESNVGAKAANSVSHNEASLSWMSSIRVQKDPSRSKSASVQPQRRTPPAQTRS